MSGHYGPSSNQQHYITLREAVELGYGAYSTLRSWIAQGKLPAVKTGGRVKLLRSDLDALARPVGSDPLDAAIQVLETSADQLSADQRQRLAGLVGDQVVVV